jgi:uncharacterized protein YecA (UPF0149 family)
METRRLRLSMNAFLPLLLTEAAFPTPSKPSRGTLQPSSGEPLRRQSNVGRNALCPCGSGKKFKKCCKG